MNVLQIACGFSYSNVYKNLFTELNKKKIGIEVYNPQHTDVVIKDLAHSEYSYPIYANKVIKRCDKYLYFTKIKRMQRDVELNFDLTNIKVIHAHSLFSDGAVAYEIYKKHKIPYIVAVRDMDVNQYFKKAKHLKSYALKVLTNASVIVFLSKSYKDNVIEKFVPSALQPDVLNKSVVIPNGISNFWLQNTYDERPKFNINKEEINLIFVGQIIKRKNIESIIRARNQIGEATNKKIKLLLIGEKKDEGYFKYISNLGEFHHIGHCSAEELINYYRESDIFVMPSLTETFGLVYAEAISQGLPVIYTKGQGFDGQFEEGVVGYGIDPVSVKDFSQKIHIILKDYDSISTRCINKCVRFDWDKITEDYSDLYECVSVGKVN